MSDEPPSLPPPPFWRTVYYQDVASKKPGREKISIDHILLTLTAPASIRRQDNGRYALHRYEPDLQHWLCVIVLDDRKTVHNAYPNRSFRP